MDGYIDKLLGGRYRDRGDVSTDEINRAIQQYIDQFTSLKGEATRLISGTVTWIENLDFQVSHLVYNILNRRYESAERLITIPANLENDPMFVLIVADVFGNVSYLPGIAAESPAFPLINSSTQILITPVYIPALGTEPGTDPGGEVPEIVTEIVYNENVEWGTAMTGEAGITVNLAAEIEPELGAKHIAINFENPALTSAERSVLLTSPDVNSGVQINMGDYINGDYTFELSELFTDHKTDSIVDGIRHLIYYRFNKASDVEIVLTSRTTGISYVLNGRSTPVINEVFSVPEIGFTVDLRKSVRAHIVHDEIPDGDYTLSVSGFIRYDQQYIIRNSALLEPAITSVSFSRATAINAKGGKLILSLKTSASWLSTSGILFELYNGPDKIGIAALLSGNMFDFNPNNTEYQRITVPISAFNPVSDEITRLVIRPVNAWPNTNLYIDNIVLQTGITTETQTDRYVESVGLAEENEKLALSLNRSAGLPPLKALFGTLAAKGFWTGTQAAYDAIAVKNANTIYFVEEA